MATTQEILAQLKGKQHDKCKFGDWITSQPPEVQEALSLAIEDKDILAVSIFNFSRTCEPPFNGQLSVLREHCRHACKCK